MSRPQPCPECARYRADRNEWRSVAVYFAGRALAQALWDMLMQQPGVRPDLQQPGAPWLASVPYATLITDLDAARWMGDFERTCAWAWVTRNPTIEAV